MVPSDPPGVLRVPILGPNRGMFSKLNGPSPLGSGGHSYTSFSIGRFYAQWNSFGGDVSYDGAFHKDSKSGLYSKMVIGAEFYPEQGIYSYSFSGLD